MYNISSYSYDKARDLGVSIFPSKTKNKKIDIYKENKFLFSIGSLGMNDYPTYLKTKGKLYAEERRRLYHLRHKNDNVRGTRGWYSLNILW